MTTPETRCPATHSKDNTPCEGPQDAVKIVDKLGTETLACVHHGARMYASLIDPHVYPVTDEQAAIEVYNRAQNIRPFEWLTPVREFGSGEVS